MCIYLNEKIIFFPWNKTTLYDAKAILKYEIYDSDIFYIFFLLNRRQNELCFKLTEI